MIRLNLLLIFVFFLLFALVTFSHFCFHSVPLIHFYIFLILYSPARNINHSLILLNAFFNFTFINTFTVINWHCFSTWYSGLILLSDIYKLFNISSRFSFIFSVSQPNPSAASFFTTGPHVWIYFFLHFPNFTSFLLHLPPQIPLRFLLWYYWIWAESSCVRFPAR